jgi:hypothetical protein
LIGATYYADIQIGIAIIVYITPNRRFGIALEVYPGALRHFLEGSVTQVFVQLVFPVGKAEVQILIAVVIKIADGYAFGACCKLKSSSGSLI